MVVQYDGESICAGWGIGRQVVIYFIRAGGRGPVKIGRAVNVKRRLESLQISHWEKLRLLRTMPGNDVVERWMHHHFRKHRIRGEWFHYHDAMRTIDVPVEVAATDAREHHTPVIQRAIGAIRVFRWPEYDQSVNHQKNYQRARAMSPGGWWFVEWTDLAGIRRLKQFYKQHHAEDLATKIERAVTPSERCPREQTPSSQFKPKFKPVNRRGRRRWVRRRSEVPTSVAAGRAIGRECPYCHANAEITMDLVAGLKEVTRYRCNSCGATEILAYDDSPSTPDERGVGWYRPSGEIYPDG